MTKHRYIVTFRRQSSKTLSAPVYARNALEARRKAWAWGKSSKLEASRSGDIFHVVYDDAGYGNDQEPPGPPATPANSSRDSAVVEEDWSESSDAIENSSVTTESSVFTA